MPTVTFTPAGKVATMKNVRFELNGQPAFVSFLSRYRGQNDFLVEQHPRHGRVSRRDDGTISTTSEHWTVDDAKIAIAAHAAADAEQFAAWQAQQAS